MFSETFIGRYNKIFFDNLIHIIKTFPSCRTVKHQHFYSTAFWFTLIALCVHYQERSNKFTQVSADVLFWLKGKHSYRRLFTVCESLFASLCSIKRHEKQLGSKNTLWCLHIEIIKEKLWKSSALYSSAHSKTSALRNRGETTDFLLANIWRANLEGLGEEDALDGSPPPPCPVWRLNRFVCVCVFVRAPKITEGV